MTKKEMSSGSTHTTEDLTISYGGEKMCKEKPMKGQLNLFDLVPKSEACSYRFQRYLGQPVEFWSIKPPLCGVIVEIKDYYTEVLTDYGIKVGTPTTICPISEES